MGDREAHDRGLFRRGLVVIRGGAHSWTSSLNLTAGSNGSECCLSWQRRNLSKLDRGKGGDDRGEASDLEQEGREICRVPASHDRIAGSQKLGQACCCGIVYSCSMSEEKGMEIYMPHRSQIVTAGINERAYEASRKLPYFRETIETSQ